MHCYIFKVYNIFVLHVFGLYFICTVHSSLYTLWPPPSYKAPITRGQLAMQQIKLTYNYSIITSSQDNCVRVNTIQNVCW